MFRTCFQSQKITASLARSFTTLSLLASFHSQESNAQNTPHPEGFRVPEIVMRADSGSSMNLPPLTYFGLESPLFTNKDEVILRYSVWGGEEQDGLLKYDSKNKTLISHKSSPNSFPSSIRLDETSGQIFFESVNYGYFSEGIYQIDKNLQNSARVINDKSVQFSSDLGVLNEGLHKANGLVSRAKQDNGALSIRLILLESGSAFVEKTLLATAHNNPQSPYSYIFPPSTSASGYIGVKVRLGKTGEIADSQPDQILVFKLDPTTHNFNLIKSIGDIDAIRDSTFRSFDNSPLINDSGTLVFAAQLKNGNRAIYKWSEKKGLQRIVEEAKGTDLEEIRYFAPSLNSKDEIVFRAKGPDGESIWHASAQLKLTRLLKRGDRVKSDMGWAHIGPSARDEMSFFLSPQINDQGNVLIGALVDLEGPNARSIGLGFYVIRPE